MEDKKYYVYLHIRNDNNKCFYVGKGHDNRAYTSKGRSSLHKKIASKYGYYVKILKDGLTESEACDLEIKAIQSFVDKGFKLANNGYKINEDEDFLVNHTIGGEDGCFRKGEENPMYGVSPKERMDHDTYEEWYRKTHIRLNNQFGENNPNYGNDTLKKKLETNPELKKIYYSRPGSQNGRAVPVSVRDLDGNHIADFNYIGECCQWLKEKLNLKTSINSLRSNMRIAINKNKPFHGFMFYEN